MQRTAITRIESGDRPVSTLELDRLAQLYRRPIREFLTDSVPSSTEPYQALISLVPEFQADPGLAAEPLRVLELIGEGGALESILDARAPLSPPGYDLPFPADSGEAILQGFRLAEAERRRLGFGDSTIGDIEDLLFGQGVWAASTLLPESVFGAMVRCSQFGVAVITNSGLSITEQRFAFAREYAHVLDRERSGHASFAESSNELLGKRADAFASAFLMPANGVSLFLDAHRKGRSQRAAGALVTIGGRQTFEVAGASATGDRMTPPDVSYLAHHFGVGYRVALSRLAGLRFLTVPEFEELGRPERVEEGRRFLELFGLQERREIRTTPPQNGILSLRIARLAVDAYRRELISAGRLKELARRLGISAPALLQVADGSGIE